MSVVRVVARIRPHLESELERDNIVHVQASPLDAAGSRPTTLSIPNPKQASEKFSFQFNSVYDSHASQQDLFDSEVAPTVKHLFAGFDTTIFAYGVTGTGKTHTMRGGKSLADRGVIPRLLSSIYRRSRKIEKESTTRVEVSMSYYEIYNDRVFDLFEPPEKRTLAGLPIREANGKTVVAGLTERPCTSLKEFEQLYDQANINRSTSATKLNAHSSRSHAILAVKLSQIEDDRTIVSTASAIDLAGSEDNRRTDNSKERLVESSSINRSLFVLAQCVEAIGKKQSRIPYRESKMTRILSLGQNQGLTLMILNIAPLRSYHLDTLSSLNFANRTKKIEIRDVENEPIFLGKAFPSKQTSSITGQPIHRQPLKAIHASTNNALRSVTATNDKPVKSFSVFAEKSKINRLSSPRNGASLKRGSDSNHCIDSRPSKTIRPSITARFPKPREPEISRSSLEELVNRMVDEKLAKQALNDTDKTSVPSLSAEVQARLEALEQRVEKKEDGRAEGLQYLLMGKQHQIRGEESSALKMYQLALPFFPENEKLAQKMLALQEKIRSRRDGTESFSDRFGPTQVMRQDEAESDDEYREDFHPPSDDDYESDAASKFKPKSKARKLKISKLNLNSDGQITPRTSRLLDIINTRDLSQIRALKGVGAKRAEAIVSCLCEMDEGDDGQLITDIEQLGGLKGVSFKMVENMRSGIVV